MIDDQTISRLYNIICKKIGCKYLKIDNYVSFFKKHYEYILKATFSDNWSSYLYYGTYGISRDFILIDVDIAIELKTYDETKKMIVEKILEIGKCHNIYVGPIYRKLVIEAGTTPEKLLIEGDLDD